MFKQILALFLLIFSVGNMSAMRQPDMSYVELANREVIMDGLNNYFIVLGRELNNPSTLVIMTQQPNHEIPNLITIDFILRINFPGETIESARFENGINVIVGTRQENSEQAQEIICNEITLLYDNALQLIGVEVPAEIKDLPPNS